MPRPVSPGREMRLNIILDKQKNSPTEGRSGGAIGVRQRFLFGLWIAGVACVVALSLAPGSYIEKISIPSVSDKLEHLAAYFVLATLGMIALPSRAAGIYSIVGLAVMGVLIEEIQRVVPGRGFEFGDIFANVSGLCLGALLGVLLRSEPTPDHTGNQL